MRRLLIFCDGTWNKETAAEPTNVVLAAEAVLPAGPDGTDQIVYYGEGVGTSYLINQKVEQWAAGAFGWGLFDHIADAYRFIVFNYQPGDEVFIFGFSRGAFTARSLAGLIRKCGIIPKGQVKSIADAFAFYQRDDIHPDDDAAQEFRATYSPDTLMKQADIDWRRSHGMAVPDVPLFTIKYLGVWDTVGELGVPKDIMFSDLINAKYHFHDPSLSSTVAAARHAVAVDESRVAFTPALWDNLDILNKIDDRAGNYLQLWFPGDHGSVGGGGDIRGLSSDALVWIIEGAVRQGMSISPGAIAEWTGKADFRASLHNSSKPGDFFDHVYTHQPRTGPTDPSALADNTTDRLLWNTKGAGPPYRPESLAPLLAAHPELIDGPVPPPAPAAPGS